ncbi:hypothetical protein DMH08_36320 [Actinomadura sp. WAC 06369]|nr:hypothetical protein DMH08_36320 [Actinomadura sp. WAC 06369]
MGVVVEVESHPCVLSSAISSPEAFRAISSSRRVISAATVPSTRTAGAMTLSAPMQCPRTISGTATAVMSLPSHSLRTSAKPRSATSA